MVATEANSINAATTGIVGNTGTSFTGTAVTQYNVLLGGSTSSTLSNVAPSATSGVPLISQGAASNPVFGTALVAGGGTGAVTLTGVLTGNGTSAVTASTVTQHGVLVGGASNAVSSTAVGSTGQVLQANTGADPTYSTATFPSTATSTGTILRANGTNWVATTATYPTTTTSQQILYSTATSVIGELTTANSALAATNSSGTLAMRLFSVVTQVFTSTGTYTPTAGMLYCIIECIGGGGAGGGAAATGAGTTSCAGGGGGGEYARGVFSAATIGVSKAVTIGAAGTGNSGATGGNGGNTSVGSTNISANGGSGGITGAAAATVQALGGAGGTGGTGGDFRTPGSVGGWAISNLTPGFILGGSGANTQYGSGGNAITTTATTGNAGAGYGAGGGGATNYTSQSASTGGAGTKGVVIVTEFVIS
jgi:hypothetical protein